LDCRVVARSFLRVLSNPHTLFWKLPAGFRADLQPRGIPSCIAPTPHPALFMQDKGGGVRFSKIFDRVAEGICHSGEGEGPPTIFMQCPTPLHSQQRGGVYPHSSRRFHVKHLTRNWKGMGGAPHIFPQQGVWGSVYEK
jgi:hypothetical protein